MAGSGLHCGGQRRCPLHLPAHCVGPDDAADFHRLGFLRRALPPASRGSGLAACRFHASRINLVDYPAFRVHGDLRLGSGGLLQESHAASRLDRGLRGRQAMDVEAGTRRGPARDQRTARARRPRREADHDFAGRDPQLLRSRLPHETGRAAGPLYGSLVPRHQARYVPPVLCRILRHATLRSDVIHSFYVPAFRMKQDGLPGRYTVAWFRATKPGTYHLFCAEYCGTQHSGMIGSIVVMEPAQFEAWMNGGTTGPLSATGEKIFAARGCVTCHRTDTQGRGPNLQGVFGKPVMLEVGRTVTADENYIHESILDPGAKVVNGFKPVMPTFQGLVSEEQLNALVAYVKSLSQPVAAGNKTAAATPQDNSKAAGSQVQ